MPRLQTATLSNQNISAALLVGTFTAVAECSSLMAQVFVDQVAGNGDYSLYLTHQISGAGSAYKSGVTTIPVANGVTSFHASTIIKPVNNTDVIKVYLLGLAGDTVTPDITCEFWDLGYLRPTTAGRTVDVAATGEVGLDFDNIHAAANPTMLTNITVPTVTSITNAVLANLTQILGFALTETVAGYLAAGLKKFLDVATPVFTLASKNQGADNDTKLTNIQSRLPAALTVDGNIMADALKLNGAIPNNLTAQQVWDILVASLITPNSIGAWILDKLDVKVSSVSGAVSVPTVAQIWQYAWRTLTTGSAKSGVVEDSSTISIRTYETLNYQLSDLGSLANYATIYFTLKSSKKDDDSESILQVCKKVGGVGDGLLKILGGTITPAALDGSITIDDATTGIITISIKASVMALLKSGKYFADVKIIRSAGILVEVLRDYNVNLLDTTTKAIV